MRLPPRHARRCLGSLPLPGMHQKPTDTRWVRISVAADLPLSWGDAGVSGAVTLTGGNLTMVQTVRREVQESCANRRADAVERNFAAASRSHR
jgi:hypothetical protein